MSINDAQMRTPELATAHDMHSSAKSVPFFRNLLNERQFPLTASQAKELTKKAEPVWEHTCPTCGRELAEDGCKRHGVAKHESRRQLGEARPELVNIVWKTWLADRQRMVIVVQQTMTKHVQVMTDTWESETKQVTFDRFFVTMAEQATLEFGRVYPKNALLKSNAAADAQALAAMARGYDTPLPIEGPSTYNKRSYVDKTLAKAEIEVANKVYFGRGVPLGPWVKSWTVFEPVEEFHGPFDLADDALVCADRWASQINDELRDHRQAFEEIDPLASVS